MAEFSHFWPARDLRYARLMMPRYCRRAAAVISVSQITTETFNQTFDLPEEKIRTVYFGPGRQFKRVEQPERLAEVKRKYDLPDHFIFTLTGYERGPRKNIAGLLRAYELTHGQTGHSLVIGGKGCHRFKTDFAIPDEGYGQDVLFPGWIAQEDLPAVYSLADLFLYPSRIEAFPIPITEALACGTPIVTSNANGLRELAGGAAVLVDPDRPEEIAAAVTRVLTDAALRADLSARGLARAAAFTWDRCARETLAILEEVAKEEVERANVD
jgi:glycosyltransferase involved in cell wall biosynthesis